MIEKIEEWIRQVNRSYEPSRQACSKFQDQFNGFYSKLFLESAYFVIINEIPKPDYPELREAGLGDFIDMDVDGVTYNDTYYVKPDFADDFALHFHELVHVVQWRTLTPKSFIERYIQEIQGSGYAHAPLEKMAYRLDAHYRSNGRTLDVEEYVRANL